MAIIKNMEITGVGEDIEKLEPSDIAGGDIKWCISCEKQLGNSSRS